MRTLELARRVIEVSWLHSATGSLFWDSDDEWLPEKLEKQIAFLQEHTAAKILQTNEIWLRNGARIYPKAYHKKAKGWAFVDMLERCLISPSSVIVHRQVFDKVGFFDENLPACEDYDLWLRTGVRFPVYLLVDELVTKYGGHEDQLSRQTELDRYRIQSLEKIRDTIALPGDWLEALEKKLAEKCRIYAQGLRKHGKEDEALAYEKRLKSAYNW